MYQKKTDNVIYFVAAFMVTFVLTFMAGTTYCRVQKEEIKEKPKEVKMFARIEGWNNNNKDFKINENKVEIDLNATGSTTNVKYTVHISNIPEGVKLYKDENYLYELDNDFEGIIEYKETMKEKIIFFIENQNTLDEEIDIPTFNVKLNFEKQGE